MQRFLLKNSDGKKSVTMTSFVIGFVVVNAKLIFSGMSFGGFTVSQFTGSEYGVAVAALGSVYTLRRNFGDTSGTKSE